MNDHWITKTGARWNKADRDRVSRLFRAHVDTPSNRAHGRSCRIKRQPCHWHPDVEAEAHHVDYAKPFVVVWAGLTCGCHREIDHGTKKVPKKAIWDYTSLIDGPYGVAQVGRRREGPRESRACTCGRRPRGTPHRPECPRFLSDDVSFGATGT